MLRDYIKILITTFVVLEVRGFFYIILKERFSIHRPCWYVHRFVLILLEFYLNNVGDIKLISCEATV